MLNTVGYSITDSSNQRHKILDKLINQKDLATVYNHLCIIKKYIPLSANYYKSVDSDVRYIALIKKTTKKKSKKKTTKKKSKKKPKKKSKKKR